MSDNNDDIDDKEEKEEKEEKCPETIQDPPSFPDELTETIIKLHYVYIACTGYVIIYILLSLIYPAFFIIGFNIDIKTLNITGILKLIFWLLYILSGFVSVVLFVILFWIFIHWLIIIIFVPIIIIFPIPIFPFIFILPLQPLMLELIPPFKVLTNTGTLPTMLTISKRLLSDKLISNTLNYFFKPTVDDLRKYFYLNIKNLISDIFYYDIENVYNIPPEKCKTSKKDIINSIKTDDNIKDENTYNNYKEISSVQKSMNNISEDTELCISMHHKFKEYNASYMSDIAVDAENSYSPFNTCYTGAIKSYLKTSIAQ